jgi:hypothetical protein
MTSMCKKCNCEKSSLWRSIPGNREKTKIWCSCNPDKRAATFKKSRQIHRDELSYKNKEWRHNNPEKAKAHSLVLIAKRQGILHPAVCEICGKAGAHGHHEDYSKPLVLTWLCPLHHVYAHRGKI